MKRVLLLAILSLFGLTTLAENRPDKVNLLRQRCDSIYSALAALRSAYAYNPSRREELRLKIDSTERALKGCRAQYDSIISAISEKERVDILAAFEKANAERQRAASAKTEAKRDSAATFINQDRNLIANDFFSTQLSQENYKALQEAQRLEGVADSIATSYTAYYAELLALQQKYTQAETPHQTDSLANVFNVKVGEIKQLDEVLSETTSKLYIDKRYIYDLLMEQGGQQAILDKSALLSAAADKEIKNSEGLYISDALVSYQIRKNSLVAYELHLAKFIAADSARDSLQVVANNLKQRNFKLPPIILQRRSFIKHEPISIKGTTYYNSRNPIPRTKIYDYGTVYRIHIGTFKNRQNPSTMRGVAPLSYSNAYHDGAYAYFVGGFRTEQEANDGAEELRIIGFREPIVSVWVDGEFYPTLADMRKHLGSYNIEISGVESIPNEVKAKIEQHNAANMISRIGSAYIIGSFAGKTAAESVATDIKSICPEMSVKVVKITAQP